jgi:hypothetical protein
MQPSGCEFTLEADTWKPDRAAPSPGARLQKKRPQNFSASALDFSGNDFFPF